MCSFCDDIPTILDPHLNTEPRIYAYYDEEDMLSFAISAGDPNCGIDIFYCPYCGRKLEEE